MVIYDFYSIGISVVKLKRTFSVSGKDLDQKETRIEWIITPITRYWGERNKGVYKIWVNFTQIN